MKCLKEKNLNTITIVTEKDIQPNSFYNWKKDKSVFSHDTITSFEV